VRARVCACAPAHVCVK